MIILTTKIMSQFQVTVEMNLIKNQDINIENQLMFLIFHIQIHTQTGIIYMVVLHMLQLNIMCTIKTRHLFIRQLFHHYKYSLSFECYQNNLGSIPKFDTIIGKLKNNQMDENTS